MITPLASTASVLAADTWFQNPIIEQGLMSALGETLLMVFWSSLFSIIFGLLIGIVLTATKPEGLLPNRALYQVLAFIVNVGRSIPFIILMFVMIPLTRAVVGSATGWLGATVPLTIAAIPYFARLVESNLTGVEQGKVEAAQMMGASRSRILSGVLVREAMPALIQSATILIITLVGYSAMAGAVGGGGLGQMAINYGYYRPMADVLVILVVVIVVIVNVIQLAGDMLSRLVDHR